MQPGTFALKALCVFCWGVSFGRGAGGGFGGGKKGETDGGNGSDSARQSTKGPYCSPDGARGGLGGGHANPNDEEEESKEAGLGNVHFAHSIVGRLVTRLLVARAPAKQKKAEKSRVTGTL
jgi:hypothetical protein